MENAYEEFKDITDKYYTETDALVLGIRYQKKDRTFSEDLFLFREGKSIQKSYRGGLEKIIPEYTGTHKRKPNT